MTKNYELSCLISAKIDEIERDTVKENIGKLIKEKGGKITKEPSFSGITLGYPIRNEKKAGLMVLNFSYDDQNLTELKKELDQEKRLLRYILMERAVRKTPPPAPREKAKLTPKVELKDIDKKIEEIFSPKKDEFK